MRTRMIWGLLVLVWLLGLPGAKAAMNPNSPAGDQAIFERDHVMKVPPEELEARIVQEREQRNAEVRRAMALPPSDFPHYANPPFKQQQRTWAERMRTPGDPLSYLVIKTLLFIVVGTFLLSALVFRYTRSSRESAVGRR